MKLEVARGHFVKASNAKMKHLNLIQLSDGLWHLTGTDRNSILLD